MVNRFIVQLKGFKNKLDPLQWLVKKVTHKLNSSGLGSRLDLELFVADEPDRKASYQVLRGKPAKPKVDNDAWMYMPVK